MQEMIDGHICDTATAKRIMAYSETSDMSDISTDIAYYRTRSGVYFRHEKYGRNERIEVLPAEEVIEFAAHHPDIVLDAKWLALAEFARSGGKAKSERKAAAARENGKKGGRPRKEKSE